MAMVTNAWYCWTSSNSTTTDALTNEIWRYWMQDTNPYSCITTNSSTTDTTWRYWTNETSDVAWKYWTAETKGKPEVQGAYSPAYEVYNGPSEEELRKQKEEQERRDRERRLEELQARRRAKKLLKKVLTNDEWRDWIQYRAVRVEGSLGGRYLVEAHVKSKNTVLYELGESDVLKKKLCYHPSRDYCIEDQMAAMVLDIKVDESRLREQANVMEMGVLERDNKAWQERRTRPRLVA